MQLFLCWHVLDQVQGLFQSDLLISCVPQSTSQLKRNIFLNTKLIHKVSSWLSGSEGKGWMGKCTETKPCNENYVSQAKWEHVISWLWKTTQNSSEMAEAAGTAGACGACDNPSGSVQMSGAGESGHTQDTDHLLLMAAEWLSPHSFWRQRRARVLMHSLQYR